MSLKSDCIFCKVIKQEIPSKKIFENEDVYGFIDITPQAPIHYLFIPKFHVESLAGLTKEQRPVINKIYDAIIETAEKEKIKDLGFRTVVNTGKHGGQTVFHLHFHLISGPKLTPRFG